MRTVGRFPAGVGRLLCRSPSTIDSVRSPRARFAHPPRRRSQIGSTLISLGALSTARRKKVLEILRRALYFQGVSKPPPRRSAPLLRRFADPPGRGPPPPPPLQPLGEYRASGPNLRTYFCGAVLSPETHRRRR